MFTTISNSDLATTYGGADLASNKPVDLSKLPLDQVVFHPNGMASTTTPTGGCRMFSVNQLELGKRMRAEAVGGGLGNGLISGGAGRPIDINPLDGPRR